MGVSSRTLVQQSPSEMGLTVAAVLGVLLIGLPQPNAQIIPSAFPETCSAGAPPCTARIAHIANGNQTLADIAAMYNVDVYDIMGANDVDSMEPDVTTKKVPSSNLLFVPFRCNCIDGLRQTNDTVYVVQHGDTLSAIAKITYQHLVTFGQIGVFNNISNVDKISVGEKFIIPFLCACNNNTFNGSTAVYLTYVIQAGDTVEFLAEMFGVPAIGLESLNFIQNPKGIMATSLLQIPVPACASQFDKNTLDYGLLVTKGSYSLSPEGRCVQSSCYGYPTPMLHSTPFPSAVSAGKCPSMECENGIVLGSFQTSSLETAAGCRVTSCIYDGYANSTAFFSRLEVTNASTCPVIAAAPPEKRIEDGMKVGPSNKLPDPPETPAHVPSPSNAPPTGIFREALVMAVGLGVGVCVALLDVLTL